MDLNASFHFEMKSLKRPRQVQDIHKIINNEGQENVTTMQAKKLQKDDTEKVLQLKEEK